MLVNISKAAKLAGITRETLYKNYINKGKISTTRDARNRPAIDTAEILRVFGRLDGVEDTHTNEQEATQKEDTPHTTAELARLQAENAQLRERLDESKERESWQRGQIEKLTDTIKMLEAPKNTTQQGRLTGFLGRLFGG